LDIGEEGWHLRKSINKKSDQTIAIFQINPFQAQKVRSTILKRELLTSDLIK